MTGIITLIVAGTDTGPFDLYSNADGYSSAFASSVSKLELTNGYPSNDLPIGATTVKIKSTGLCTNFVEVIIPPVNCYNFLPTVGYYTLSTIYSPLYGYFYGRLDGYLENGVLTNSKNLIKLNPDLTLDDSFNVGTGFDEILYTGSSIIEQADGKIIATGTFTSYQGTSKNRLVRLNIDGSIDNTFQIGVGFNDFTQGLDIDSNGSILVTGRYSSYNGTFSPRIVRLFSNGSIDTSLIVGSSFNDTTTDVLVAAENSLIILGYFTAYNGIAVSPGISKILSNGTLDPSFNAGTGTVPYFGNNANYFLRIKGETSFYIFGYISSYNGTPCSKIIKIQENGTVDPSFTTGSGFNGTNIYNASIVWGDKLLLEGNFTTYTGAPSLYSIILNKDGSVLYAFTSVYRSPVVIGDNLFAAPSNGCLKLLYTFIP